METFRKPVFKFSVVVLMLYTLIGGFLMPVPKVPIVNETIRNQYFHVSMWFAMLILLAYSVYHSIRYLANNQLRHDHNAAATASSGLVLGILGIITGAIWAKFTWGAYWSGDPKQNGAAIAMLIYLAYFVLRSSIDDQQTRARISAVFNLFAFASLIPLLYILPRMTDSLHPGSGGNPGFNIYDLDNTMRMVFYPSILAWSGLFFWIASLRARSVELNERMHEYQTNFS